MILLYEKGNANEATLLKLDSGLDCPNSRLLSTNEASLANSDLQKSVSERVRGQEQRHTVANDHHPLLRITSQYKSSFSHHL